ATERALAAGGGGAVDGDGALQVPGGGEASGVAVDARLDLLLVFVVGLVVGGRALREGLPGDDVPDLRAAGLDVVEVGHAETLHDAEHLVVGPRREERLRGAGAERRAGRVGIRLARVVISV